MRRFLFSVLLLLSAVSRVAAAEESLPAVEIPGLGTWFPNTALQPPVFDCCDVRGWPAYRDEQQRWLFAVTGGLARFDSAAGSFTFFPITPDAPLSGIARVGSTVWLSASERLI